MVGYDPAIYRAKRTHPTRDTYAAVFTDILDKGYSFIRMSSVNRMKSRMRREQLRWSFHKDGGRYKITPMKE